MEEDIPCMSYPFYSTLLLGIIKIGECIWHLSRLYPSPTSNVDRGLDIVLFSSVKREGLIVEKKKVALIQGQLVLMWPSTRSSSSVVEPRPTDFELYVNALLSGPLVTAFFGKYAIPFLKVVLLLTQRELLSERYCTIGMITKIQDL